VERFVQYGLGQEGGVGGHRKRRETFHEKIGNSFWRRRLDTRGLNKKKPGEWGKQTPVGVGGE